MAGGCVGGVQAAIGPAVHHYELARRSIRGAGSNDLQIQAPAAPLESALAEMMHVDVGTQVGRFYAAWEAELGEGTIEHPTASPAFSLERDVTAFGLAAVAGVVLTPPWRVTARLDVAAGGFALVLHPGRATTAATDACNELHGADACTLPSVTSWLLEPRLHVDATIRSWLGIDAWGGLGIGPSEGDRSAGLAVWVR